MTGRALVLRGLLAPALLAWSTGAHAAPQPSYPPELDRQYDLALERYYAQDFAAAAVRLHAVFRALPETELKRDAVEFHFASALERLGLVQGAIEHYIDVITGRRSPELVGRALGALDDLVRSKRLDEHRLIDHILFGNQYGDLPGPTQEFVQYYQAVGELRRGYDEWGTRRLEELGKSDGYYGMKARYALGVQRLKADNDQGAEQIWKALGDDDKTPKAVRNDARLALARLAYERKKYPEAFEIYSSIDSPLPAQDVVLLEKAWNQLLSQDERRALGMVVGLGAPVYQRLFAPERSLLRAFALKRLCQFRGAHQSVLDFRKKYKGTLQRIRNREPLLDDPVLRQAVMRRDDLLPTRRWRDALEVEKRQADQLDDRALRDYLGAIYKTKLALADVQLRRQLERALGQLAEDLLAVEEQINILDYELGIELFRRIGEGDGRTAEAKVAIPRGSDRVYYKFTGEYWSDELHDYNVLVEDRCVR